MRDRIMGEMGGETRSGERERSEPEAYVESVSIEHGHRIGFHYGTGTPRFPVKARVEFICNTAFASRLYEWLNAQGIGRSPAAPAPAPSPAPRLPPAPILGVFEDDEEEHEDHG